MKYISTNGENKKVAEAHQPCVNVIVAIFSKFTLLNYKGAQLRAFAAALLIVGQKARNPWHIMQLITALEDEATEKGVPLSKRGTYLLKRVQGKPLPKVNNSYNPFVDEESLK